MVSLAMCPAMTTLNVVLLRLFDVVRAHVHADDRSHFRGGEFFEGVFRTLGPPGHVHHDLAAAVLRGARHDLGPYSEAGKVTVFRDLHEEVENFLHVVGGVLVKELLEMARDLVVGRRVDTEERHFEKAGGVGGPAVVDGKHPVGDLLDAVAEDALGHGNGDAHGVEDIGLHPHDVVETRQGAALGMVGENEVEGALLPKPVGEDEFAHLHVDTDEDALDFGLR